MSIAKGSEKIGETQSNVSDSKEGLKSMSHDFLSKNKLFLNQQQKGQKNLEGHKTMWLPPKKA